MDPPIYELLLVYQISADNILSGSIIDSHPENMSRWYTSHAMDAKSLRTLEYDKVLENLASYTSFAASAELVRKLTPSAKLNNIRQALAQTREAQNLLSSAPQTSIGGARDIRELTEGASRGRVLLPGELLDVKFTLVAARTLARSFEKSALVFPYLWQITQRFPGSTGLIDRITRTISDKGEVLDSASPALVRIRSELRITHDRLLERMQKLLNNKSIAPYLQEALVTQRDGRYVLPIKAEAKGRVKSVVHDSSSSGATLFVEPLQVVELNNAWRELQLAEEEEVRRVLAEVSALVGEKHIELQAVVDALAEFDFALARGKYAENLKASEPQLKEFQPNKDKTHPGLTLQLYQARHPLLDQDTVVPVDVELDPSTYVMVITGPNTGGKTVTLKTVGLLALMAQSGMFIPAQTGSQLSLFSNIYADIGDEQSIEQSLSTFSGHVTNIIELLDKADQRTLVILDELGAGTDPQEGAALAQAILDHLVEQRIPTLVATHYPELKTYAHATAGVVNASVEFDLETLRPTYHLTVGLPGRSNALAIASRLGLQPQIVERARSSIDPTELHADDLLDEIHRQRELSRQARQAAERAQTEAESLRNELVERLEKIEDERLQLMDEARQLMQAETEELHKEINEIRKELARARQPLEVLEKVENKIEEIEAGVEQPLERQQRTKEVAPALKRPIKLGDRVKLRTLGKEGVVTSLGEEEAEIQIGNLRVRVELYDLVLVGGQAQEKDTKVEAAPRGDYRTASPGAELNLRGMAVDEALEAMDRYLDRAFMAGLPFARIVHGKGTGKLRDAVRQELKGHPHVKRFEEGGPSEGGDGITVVFLKSG